MLSDVLQKGSPRHHFGTPATPEGPGRESKKPEKDGPVEVQVWHPTGAASNSLHKNSSLEHKTNVSLKLVACTCVYHPPTC